MSLIEEALRKQEREAGRRPPITPPAFTAALSPAPGEQQEPKRQQRRVWRLVIGGILFLGLVLFGLVILPATVLRPALQQQTRPVPEPAPRPLAPPAAPAPQPVAAPASPKPATNPPPILVTNVVVITNAPTVPPPPPPPPVVWPELVYKGTFIANGETQAVFNGDLVLEIGAMSSSGVTLVNTGERSARVRYKDEERVYRRGGGILSTNRP